ncbi:MAG: hypothetical protein M1348_01890 [Candidatus Parvarchaeota archaeon]|nr:hypothetical protein [Candidatus Parvarchaeota archaeon]
MFGLVINALFLLLVSMSLPAGYLIGVYTESEIEGLSERLQVTRFFNIFFIVIEAAALLLSLNFGSEVYMITGAVMIILNICLSAFYTSVKADLIRMVEYALIFIILSISISSILITI